MRIITLFLILILTSCLNKKDDNNNIKINSKHTFELGFQRTTTSFLYLDDQEYIGFADFRTYYKIIFFDLEGNRALSLNVKTLAEELSDGFIAFSASSLDSIALLSRHKNFIYIIDSKGELIETRDYSNIHKNIKLCPPIFFKSGKIRNGIEYSGNSTLNDISKKEYYQNFFSKKNEFFNLLFDNSTVEQEKINLQMDNLYNRFTNDTVNNTEGLHLLFTENRNIFYSAYSDSIYVYNINGVLEKIHPVRSKYSPTRAEPIGISQLINNEVDITENWRKNGYILNILADHHKEIYYCMIKHPNTKDKSTFSIVVYDNNFEAINEILFESDEYFPIGFVGKKGLYLLNKEQEFGKQTYTILDL